MLYFADSNTIGWLQIVVPTGVTLLIMLFGGWALVAKYQQKIDDAKEDIKDLKRDVHELQMKLTEVSTKLEERTGNSEAKVLTRNSPVALNDYGQKLLRDSGGDRFVVTNLEELVDKIKKLGFKSAYDVQENAKGVIESITNEERFVPIKDYAYKEGIELNLINTVMGVYLRDLALPKLGFKPEDIDASDPKNKA